MAVAYETSAVTLDTLSGGSGSRSITKPTGLASGDVWLMIISVDNNGSDGNITVPSGFTDITAMQRSGSGFPNARAFYKVATGSEGSTQSVSFGSGTYDIHAHCVRISGCDTSAPVGNWLKAASNNAPDITIQGNGSLAILYLCKYQGSTPTAPTGTTLIRANTDGGFVTTGIAYEAKDAGSYAPSTWGGTGTTNVTTLTIEFKPAAAGGTTYNDSVSETSTASDTVSSTMVTAGSVSESQTATDTPSAGNVMAASVSESGTAADTVSATTTFTLSVSESGTAADTSSSVATFVGSVTESRTATDTPSSTGSFAVSVTETAAALDSPSAANIMSASVAESRTASDTPSAANLMSASVAESGTAADTPSVAMVTSGSVSESGNAGDTVSQGGGIISDSVSETLTATDTITSTLVTSGSVSETLTATDDQVSSLDHPGGGGDTPIYGVGGSTVKDKFVPARVVTDEGKLPRRTE